MEFSVKEQGHRIRTSGRSIDTLCKQIGGNNEQLTFVNVNLAFLAANLSSLVDSMNELNVKLDIRDEKLMEDRENRNGENLYSRTPFMLNSCGLRRENCTLEDSWCNYIDSLKIGKK